MSTSQTRTLSEIETGYLTETIEQFIGMMETNILYNVATPGTLDEYNNPVISYIGNNITGVITDLSAKEYQYVEPGFLPAHYSVLWTKALIPQVGDQVIWHNISWEVRNSIPIVIGPNTIYYQTILRRLVTQNLQAGG